MNLITKFWYVDLIGPRWLLCILRSDIITQIYEYENKTKEHIKFMVVLQLHIYKIISTNKNSRALEIFLVKPFYVTNLKSLLHSRKYF